MQTTALLASIPLILVATAGCQSSGPVRKAVTKHTAAAFHQMAADQQIRETHPADEFPVDSGQWVAPRRQHNVL